MGVANVPLSFFMGKHIVIEKIKEKIIVPLEEIGYELVDVEVLKKFGQENITIYIDKPSGIQLDDCEKAHHLIDPLIEEIDPFEDTYILNVSSPGLDRHFKSQRDFERNYDKDIEIKLNAPLKGKKYLEGKLVKRDDASITLVTKNGEIKLENTKINFVRPLVKFE